MKSPILDIDFRTNILSPSPNINVDECAGRVAECPEEHT